MTQQNIIQPFDGKQVRIAWDEEEKKYSNVEVVERLPKLHATRWKTV